MCVDRTCTGVYDTGLQPFSRQCSAEAPTALMESSGESRCVTLLLNQTVCGLCMEVLALCV